MLPFLRLMLINANQKLGFYELLTDQYYSVLCFWLLNIIFSKNPILVSFSLAEEAKLQSY